MGLERLWAGWRSAYVSDPREGKDDSGCVLCRLVAVDDDEGSLVLERTDFTITLMNLYPYTSGHVMVAPLRHTPDLDDLDDSESIAVTHAMQSAISAIKTAYSPGGINVGLNQGAAAGAGVPGHLHIHVLPRWAGDTNFMTTVAEARVMPEDVRSSYSKLAAGWPELRRDRRQAGGGSTVGPG